MRKFAIPFVLAVIVPNNLSARAETLPVEATLSLAARGEILPLAEVLRHLRPAIDGDIIEVAVDREGDRYFYRIKALAQNGRYREHRLDAKTGDAAERPSAAAQKQ